MMQMDIAQNEFLKPYNSFGVAAEARYFMRVRREDELIQIFGNPDWEQQSKLVLGGGTNMLFVDNFNGLLLKMDIPGIRSTKNGLKVLVSAGAGVLWNDLVGYCVNHGFAGIENMALIPGTAGAAPVQNIGAYGVELMDVFDSCRAFDTHRKEMVSLKKADCGFAYRDSIFKHQEKNRYIVTEISLMLSLHPIIHSDYGAIQAELEARGISHPGIKDMAEVVSHIRLAKLPDPSTIGNAGSFFKNPIIPQVLFEELNRRFPEIVHYPAGEGLVKLAAGWLIEYCGWKGKRLGAVGTWKNQALVLVNHGGASGREIYQFSAAIMEDVKNTFGIQLEREVNVIGALD
ncbi:UDP-N-acetylmuramate dehydrogenase [bacterium A37T11]|nr:UDP-N-acetylmuramate dehydrogenase [bacterium A37T11]